MHRRPELQAAGLGGLFLFYSRLETVLGDTNNLNLKGKILVKPATMAVISCWVILFLFFKDENIIKKIMGPEFHVCSLQEVKPKDSYPRRLLMVLTLYLTQKSPELLWFCIVHGTFS